MSTMRSTNEAKQAGSRVFCGVRPSSTQQFPPQTIEPPLLTRSFAAPVRDWGGLFQWHFSSRFGAMSSAASGGMAWGNMVRAKDLAGGKTREVAQILRIFQSFHWAGAGGRCGVSRIGNAPKIFGFFRRKGPGIGQLRDTFSSIAKPWSVQWVAGPSLQDFVTRAARAPRLGRGLLCPSHPTIKLVHYQRINFT
jgi:hypothetical protein